MTPLVLDIETNQLSPFNYDSRILYMGLRAPNENGEPFAVFTPDRFSQALHILEEAFKAGVPILGHKLKFDLIWLAQNGLRIPKEYKYRDTMLLAYSRGYKNITLDGLIKNVLKQKSHKKIVDVKKLEGSLFTDEIEEYLRGDLGTTHSINRELRLRGPVPPLYPFLCNLSKSLISIEHNGIYVPKDRVRALARELEQKLIKLDEEVRSLGYHVNLGAPEQSLQFLRVFGYKGLSTNSKELQLYRVKLNRIQGKKYKDLIKALDLVMEYRKTAKLLTTFVPLLLKCPGDRLHSEYYLVPYEGKGAKTGRLSSSPNAQNFPPAIKRILYAPEGYCYIHADYSQVELRIGAMLAREKRLLEKFKDPKSDIHQDTVDMIKSYGLTNIEPGDLRTVAKNFNFGVGMYGAGSDTAQTIIAKAGVYIEEEEIKAIARGWKALYPRIAKNANKFRKIAEEERKLRTPTGRKFTFEEGFYNSAANVPIQSLAADVCLTGLNQVEQRLCDSEIKLVSSVHDAIDLQVPIKLVEREKDLNGFIDEVRRLMTEETVKEFEKRFDYKLTVPIAVGVIRKDTL